MSAEKKFYPNSNYTRSLALEAAFMANAGFTLNNPLTQRTKDRLQAVKPLHDSKMQEMANKKAICAGLMAQKETMRKKTAMFCSHFYQVLNLCIKRGEYSPAVRSFYNLPVDSDALPPLKTQWNVASAAEQLLTGEQQRVAQGGVPMSRPSAAEVEAVFTVYRNLISTGSNAKDALDLAQEAVQKLNKEVNGVIKKVWAEVETFYNEQQRESMREHARRWGVVYARKGNSKKITGTVTDSVTGAPVAGVKLQLATGRNKTVTGADGRFVLSTTLMHTQILTAKLKGYDTTEIKAELYEDKDTVCNLVMVKI